MNIYLLKNKDVKEKNVDLAIRGYVVIAQTEKSARKLAASDCENEKVWLNPKLSSIKLIGISNNGNVREEVILMDEF